MKSEWNNKTVYEFLYNTEKAKVDGVASQGYTIPLNIIAPLDAEITEKYEALMERVSQFFSNNGRKVKSSKLVLTVESEKI